LTVHKLIKNITCSDSLVCADAIRLKLETSQLKLHADKKTDIVNGSITIRHIKNSHEIIIEIYDEDEQPNTGHSSTLKKPTKMPTKALLKTALNQL